MKIDTIINIHFNLFEDYNKQIENLKNLKEFLKTDNISSEFHVTEIGPNEKLYLNVSGKTRMKHSDKTISREEQAIQNLKKLNVNPVPESDFDLEKVLKDNDDIVVNNSEIEEEDDPFS